MDCESLGLKDSIRSFNKYVLSDLYVLDMFYVLEIHIAISKIVRHGLYITQMEERRGK